MVTDNEMFSLLRDVSSRVDANHRELSSKIDNIQRSVDSRMDQVEKKVISHDHYFTTTAKITKVLVPSGGVLAVIAAWLSALGSSAK